MIGGGEAIDVFLWSDDIKNIGLIKLLGERELEQNARGGCILVEGLNEGGEGGFLCVFGEVVDGAGHASFEGLLLLMVNVNLAGGVFAYQNNMQVRRRFELKQGAFELRHEVFLQCFCA